MFVDELVPIEAGLRRACGGLRPEELGPAEAAEAIKGLSRIERLAAGARIRLARRVDSGEVTDPDDHGRSSVKTHHGWALVEGTGRRPMVPPGHPDHPDHPEHARRSAAA
jgi:hypothetical protein